MEAELKVSVWILSDRPPLKKPNAGKPKSNNKRTSKVKNGGVRSFKVPSLGKNVTY